jgi:DNA-binding beta-propeller fold protein YncE
MARLRPVSLVLVALALTASWKSDAAAAEPVAWRAEADFFKLPEGFKLGACSAVAVNSRGEIFVFHRGEHPILVFDSAGKFLRSWGDGVIGSSHGLRIDREDHVWVTDIGNHRVMKFDPQGKQLLSLGTGKPSDADDAFNKPTDVAFGPKGEFFVTDGYGNTRVLAFSPSGALVHKWGSAGKGDGEFNTPHAIVIDRQGRLIVGDRENDRIQIFDADGKHLATWPGFAPYGLALDAEGRLFVADGRAHQVLELDGAGKVVGRFGKEGKGAGEFSLPHMLSFDAAGNLFVTEITGTRVQKLVRQGTK